MNAIALTISGISIRQDDQGRYCLNDLHKAAGNENKNRPSLWLKNQQTVELIAEIEKAGIPAIQSKQQLGTFAVKDLVYVYAMWISPAFTLKVIRAYDAMVSAPRNGFVQLPEPPTITKAQQGELFTLVANKARSSGKPNAYFWSRFQNHFKLSSYKLCPAAQFDDAKDYLRRLEGDDADQFMMLTPQELSKIIQENIPKQGEFLGKAESLPTSNSITLSLMPLVNKQTRRWIVMQATDSMVSLWALNDSDLFGQERRVIEDLRERGYIVVKKEEVAAKLMA